MKEQVVEKLSVLVTGAFGLVAALAWNGAIQAIFKDIFGEQSSVPAMLTYAIAVTVIAVVATIWVGKISQRFSKKEK